MSSGKEKITCITCSRCKYPVCTIEDIIFDMVSDGVTEAVFHYGFDDILNVDASVPCYSRREEVTWTVPLAHHLIKTRFSYPIRKKLLNAYIQSERAKGRSVEWEEEMRKEIEEQPEAQASSSYGGEVALVLVDNILVEDEKTNAFLTGDTPYSASSESTWRGRGPAVFQSEPTDPLKFPESMFKKKKIIESRKDIICISHTVLGHGVAMSVKKTFPRPPSTHSFDPFASDTNEQEMKTAANRQFNGKAESPEEEEATTRSVSRSLGDANEEELTGYDIEVGATALMAGVPWFKRYACTGSVECRDCHLSLGLIFERQEQEGVPSSSPGTHKKEEDSFLRSSTAATGECMTTVLEPLCKREKKETESPVRSFTSPSLPSSSLSSCTPGETKMHKKFIGLELKHIRVQEWTLTDFQKRYEASKSIESFRNLFPGVQDVEDYEKKVLALDSYGRLVQKLCGSQRDMINRQIFLLNQMKAQVEFYENKMKQKEERIASLQKEVNCLFDKCLTQILFIDKQRSNLQAQNQRLEHACNILHGQEETIEILRERLEILEKIRRLMLHEKVQS